MKNIFREINLHYDLLISKNKLSPKNFQSKNGERKIRHFTHGVSCTCPSFAYVLTAFSVKSISYFFGTFGINTNWYFNTKYFQTGRWMDPNYVQLKLIQLIVTKINWYDGLLGALQLYIFWYANYETSLHI